MPARTNPERQRTPVIEQVLRLLETSGRTDGGVPIGYTYRALAARVYDTEDPTAAQLSAVRRAVARLVSRGCAERDTERMIGRRVPWRIDLPPKQHERRRGRWIYTYDNPAGVCVFRVPTAEDDAVRPDLAAGRALWAEREARR